MQKLTIEQFIRYKKSLEELQTKYEGMYDDQHNLPNFDEKTLLLQYENEYGKCQEQLLSNDLSDIPFELWDKMLFYASDEYIIDFSKTKANIDFKLIELHGKGIYKGCNVKNIESLGSYIKEESFDYDTIKNNHQLFLSNNFTKNFKEKYYNYELTMNDVSSLNNNQLEELIKKNSGDVLSHFSLKNSFLEKILGFKRIVELYNYSREDYNNVFNLTSLQNKITSNINHIAICDALKNINIENIKKECYSAFKYQIINNVRTIKLNEYTNDFINENKDLFLIEEDISDDLREKYLKKELTYKDIKENISIFKNTDIIYFMKDDNVKHFFKKFTRDSIIKIIEKYEKILNFIFDNVKVSYLNEYLLNKDNDEIIFINSIKLFYVNYYEYKKDDNLPEWLNNQGLNLVDRYRNYDELISYNNDTIIKDLNQQYILSRISIDNIKKFNDNTSLFTNDITILGCLFKEKNDLKAFNINMNYEDFENQMLKIIHRSKYNTVTGHTSFFGSLDKSNEIFRNKYPELFIDEFASKELKNAFYVYGLDPNYIISHKEECLKYLIDKDLSEIIKGDYSFDAYNSSDNIDDTVILQKMNFIKFYSNRFGNEALIELFSMFGNFINNINYKTIDIGKNKEEIDLQIEKIILEFIKTSITNFLTLSENKTLVNKYPNIFLPIESDEELKKAYYGRNITTSFILSSLSYIETLKKIDLEMVFKRMPVINDKKEHINLVSVINDKFGDSAYDIMLLYGNYLESLLNNDLLKDIIYESNDTKETLLNKIDDAIFKGINMGLFKYNDRIPIHFKNNHSELLLDDNISLEIKNRFYGRNYSVKDFYDNSELLNIFNNINIVYGFPLSYTWLTNIKTFDNKKTLLIISEYSKINDYFMKEEFKKFVIENYDRLNNDMIKSIIEVLTKINYSNSIEMYNFRSQFAYMLLRSDNPVENLEKIEKIFIKNNLPMFGKLFMCFKIIYPNFEKSNFDFSSNSRMSPDLVEANINNERMGYFFKNKSNVDKRFQIVFNDLLNIMLKSNNRNLYEYLCNMEKGNNIYLNIISNNIDIQSISLEDRNILETFVVHLETLYENSNMGKKNDLNNLDLIDKINFFSKEFKVTSRYDLPNRIIRYFGYFAGYNSFMEMKTAMNITKRNADTRSRNLVKSTNRFILEEGDFIRGIGDLSVLGSSLNNGNVCKEYLGSFIGSSDSDTTPLDVDMSLIKENDNMYDAINGTPTGWGFGNIFLVIKKSNSNFYISRDKDGNKIDHIYDPTKTELFGTHTSKGGYETHWGIRTGIASTDIDYFIYKKNVIISSVSPYNEDGSINYRSETDYDDLPAIKFEIAKNGFYIPIVDLSGKVIYTPQEYDKLRDSMKGLSYYGVKEYDLDKSSLYFDGIDEIVNSIKIDKDNVDSKLNIITKYIEDILKNNKLDVSKIEYKLSSDISNGIAEILSTGSTSRGTCVPGDTDYDFMLRLDRSIISDNFLLNQIISKCREVFKPKNEILGKSNRFRGKGIKIPEIDEELEIDISMEQKRNNIDYTTEMALSDRLNSIKEQYPNEYIYVIANIIHAKHLLKNSNCYKSNKSDDTQGGLGGIGVENWILQNGGSFDNAMNSFLEAALDENENKRSFIDFKKKYKIWDFGQNHEPRTKGKIVYPHDEFVSDNMNEIGYNKMVNMLLNYKKNIIITDEIKNNTI